MLIFLHLWRLGKCPPEIQIGLSRGLAGKTWGPTHQWAQWTPPLPACLFRPSWPCALQALPSNPGPGLVSSDNAHWEIREPPCPLAETGPLGPCGFGCPWSHEKIKAPYLYLFRPSPSLTSCQVELNAADSALRFQWDSPAEHPGKWEPGLMGKDMNPCAPQLSHPEHSGALFLHCAWGALETPHSSDLCPVQWPQHPGTPLMRSWRNLVGSFLPS